MVRAQAPAPAEPKLGTSNSTELGLVVTTGNSRATSVGFRNVYLYRWTNRELGWETGWLRAASRDGDRFAVVRGTARVIGVTHADAKRDIVRVRGTATSGVLADPVAGTIGSLAASAPVMFT